MSKTGKIWIFVIVLLIAAIYLISPPRNLTIEISADPQGVQEFYVVTKSQKFGLIHSGGSTLVDKRLVSVNQKIKIPLASSKMNWLNPIIVNFYHPEYFWEVEGTNNKYILPKIELNPIAWTDALADSPRWLIESPSYELRTDAYHSAIAEHRIIYMSHAHYHMWFMNDKFIDTYLQSGDVNKMRKSVEVLDLIVKEFDKGMLEESIATFGPTEFVQKHIDETHAALQEIHEKIN